TLVIKNSPYLIAQFKPSVPEVVKKVGAALAHSHQLDVIYFCLFVFPILVRLIRGLPRWPPKRRRQSERQITGGNQKVFRPNHAAAFQRSSTFLIRTLSSSFKDSEPRCP